MATQRCQKPDFFVRPVAFKAVPRKFRMCAQPHFREGRVKRGDKQRGRRERKNPAFFKRTY